MKRDLDLVRKILLACEDHPHGRAPHPLKIDGYTQEQVCYHVHLMIQADLLNGSDVTRLSSLSPMAIATSMTWAGYEFLEASRDEQRWITVNTAVKAVGGMTLEVLKATLNGLATAAAKKAVGLP